MRRALTLLVVLVSCSSSDPAVTESALESDPTLVRTREGWVRGTVEGPRRAFRGIPYAAPPVGALRFRAPQPPARHDGILEATTLGPLCPQLVFSGEYRGDEDCLDLNVYTPAGATRASRLPVLVWIHGGGGRRGDVNRLDEMTLAESEGMVVVTFHYRLNAIGGFTHPEVSAEQHGVSGNNAIRDQLAVLEWVKANVSEFGGDPHHVLLGGQSAGSGYVETLMATKSAGHLFHAAAMHSYAMVPPEPSAGSLADAEARGVSLAQALDCPDLACMRALPAQDVVQASFDLQGGYQDIIADGDVLRADPFDWLREHGSPVPLLLGSTSEEIDVDFTLGDEEYPAAVAANFAEPDAVLGLYPLDAYPSAGYALATALTDQAFTCLKRAFAWAVGNARHGAPIYRYIFTHGRTNDPPHASAYHRSELGFLFGNLHIEADGPYVGTEEELDLSGEMMGYWARMAENGDPNGDGAPVWEPTDASAERILRLETGSEMEMLDAYHSAECDYFMPLPL